MPFTTENKNVLLTFAEKRGIQHHQGFENFSKNLNLAHAIVLDVRTTSVLKNLVAFVDEMNRDKAAAERITLRVAAGGKKEDDNSKSYSMTAGVEADIVVRLVGKEFQMMKIDTGKNIARIGAGVQIGDLDKKLYQQKLALSTSSLIPYVTFVGLMANAGHGTGKDQPAIAGLVTAMTILRPDGAIVRIDKTHPDFETIRGSHLGLFGIVLEVEVECVPAQKLQCVAEARSLNELIEEIKDGLFKKNSYVSIMYVPTYQDDERNEKNIIVRKWNPVSLSVEDLDSCPTLTSVEQKLAVDFSNLIHLPTLLADHPRLIPFYMKYLVSQFEVGTRDTVSIGPEWAMMHYQTAFPWDIDDADFLFNTKSDSTEVISALDHLVKTLDDCKKAGKYPVIDAIYLRYFQGTNGGLSTSFYDPTKDEHVCGLDIVSCNKIPGYADFKQKMDDFFLRSELQARPHWGKTVPLDNMDYKKMYGEKFNQFTDALERWYGSKDALAKSPFLNTFFSSILQLPAPTLQIAEEKASRPTAPAMHLIANQVLTCLKPHCGKEATTFKNQLKPIIKKGYGVRFAFASEQIPTIPDDEDQSQKRRCCSIL